MRSRAKDLNDFDVNLGSKFLTKFDSLPEIHSQAAVNSSCFGTYTLTCCMYGEDLLTDSV